MSGLDGPTRRIGGYSHLAHQFGAWEPLARFDYIDPDTAFENSSGTVAERDYLAGLTYYLQEHHAKLQVNYVRKTFNGELAVATALAAASSVGKQVVDSVTGHVLATAMYMVVAMVTAPRVLRRLANWKWNIMQRATPGIPAGDPVRVLRDCVRSRCEHPVRRTSSRFGVGGIQGKERHRVATPLDAISKMLFAVFVPIYFGIIGYRLVFGREFSMMILVGFFLGSTLFSILTSGLAAKLAGFRGLDLINIALTTNARGGPGILPASVAYDAA